MPTLTPSVEIEFECVCGTCGETLTVGDVTEWRGRFRIEVAPCDYCAEEEAE